MRVKLANKVVTRKKMTVQVRPALYGTRCDGCDQVFGVDKINFSACDFTSLHGVFEKSIAGPDGRSLGNIFSADVCSFKCAHKIFAEDGWKKMKEYRHYVKAGVGLARAEVRLTPITYGESEIRKEWKKIDETKSRDVSSSDS